MQIFQRGGSKPLSISVLVIVLVGTQSTFRGSRGIPLLAIHVQIQCSCFSVISLQRGQPGSLLLWTILPNEGGQLHSRIFRMFSYIIIANLQISPDFPVNQNLSGWLYIWVVGRLVGFGGSHAEIRDKIKHVCN